jgi:hypothetical protein
MAVTLPASTLARYRRLSLFNSPYRAHDRGHAVDLYPAGGRRDLVAPSPVAGVVRETLAVGAPDRPHTVPEDHLLLVDVDPAASALDLEDAPTPLVARVLHVDPAVCPGDRVAVGDPLGRTVRSGFFAPWVADHLHLDFRPADRNLRRASGSLPVAVAPAPEPLAWDGTGRVRAVGETYALLDAPAHPAPGERWVGVAGGPGVALDGGFPHYEGGGRLAGRTDDTEPAPESADTESVRLAGHEVGRARGRAVDWRTATVTANGHPVTGISLFLGRVADFGVKVVARDGHPFAVGDEVRVAVEN